MAKRGRPFSENPRTNRVEIRMNEKEAELLDRIGKDFGMNRPDTIRKLAEDYEANKKGD